jgi:dTDP-4-dehydrorhamnose reductase
VTGASGLLGGNLARHLADSYDVVGIYHAHEPSIPGTRLVQLDLSKEQGCNSDALQGYSPDFVIHCAGEANVDACERDPDHADRQIFRMTQSVAEFARKHGAYLVALSTDAVSDGSVEYLKESDALNPVNVYGEVKVRTEQFLAAEHESSMIVRTRFYGINVIDKASFTEHVIRELGAGREVTCFTDNYCTQIYVMNLAEVLAECLQKRLAGLYNIVEDEKVSRFEYACLVADVFGLDEKLIVAGSMSDVEVLAPRPPDTSLSNEKIKASIETDILTAAAGLAQMKKDLHKWH